MGESNLSLDTSSLMTALNSVGVSIKDFLVQMLPYLIGIAVVAFVIWLGIGCIRGIKEAIDFYKR